MKNFNKSASVLAVGVLALSAASAFAQSANWTSAAGGQWRNGNNEACWRSANWTPATAAVGCDGAIVAPPPAPPAPVAPPPPPPMPVVPVAPPAPINEKVTFASDAFFDFDKAVLKPEGKAKLDEVVGKLKGMNLEVIIAVGHTDSVGADAYNQALSLRRSEAVKAYLTSKGIDKSRVYTEGKGEKQPIADNKTAAGREKNRRVEIEVVGNRTK
jgi:OmpA-OmpF porin, OOP family